MDKIQHINHSYMSEYQNCEESHPKNESNKINEEGNYLPLTL